MTNGLQRGCQRLIFHDARLFQTIGTLPTLEQVVERIGGHGRNRCGFPFRITSGFRTKEYHQSLTERGYHTIPTSAHLKGLAADIALSDSKKRAKFVFYAMELTSELNLPFRIGLAGKSKGNFAHIDIDKTKKSPKIWIY